MIQINKENLPQQANKVHDNILPKQYHQLKNDLDKKWSQY